MVVLSHSLFFAHGLRLDSMFLNTFIILEAHKLLWTEYHRSQMSTSVGKLALNQLFDVACVV